MKSVDPKEYKVVALRECPLPESLHVCESPDHAAAYWRLHVVTNPYFNPDVRVSRCLALKHASPG